MLVKLPTPTYTSELLTNAVPCVRASTTRVYVRVLVFLTQLHSPGLHPACDLCAGQGAPVSRSDHGIFVLRSFGFRVSALVAWLCNETVLCMEWLSVDKAFL